MKQTSIVIHTLFAASCALLMSSKTFSEPMNLHTFKAKLANYQSSGEYSKELAQVAQRADEFITHTVAQHKKDSTPQKLALVLDIDETSLSNYPIMLAHQFCVDKKTIEQAMQSASDAPIEPIFKLYKHAIEQGVAVFFITGRPEYLQEPTTNNLKQAGYKDWAGLYLRPASDTEATVIPFKTRARKAITDSGYHIIASIGDQQSDLAGGFADKTFKLPNPYYFLP